MESTLRFTRLSAATVHCNTPDLLYKAIESISKYYSDLPIRVIDGSDAPYNFFELRKDFKNVAIEVFGYNIGHGPAMHKAIMECPTDYVLIFDTDIVMKKPCLEQMMALFEEDTFGVGEVNKEPQHIYNVRFGDGGDPVHVLHPYFHIVQVKEYKKYLPYVQNGGPCFLTALDIFSQRKNHVLKNFPVREYIDHRWRGTRDVKPPDMFKSSVVLNKDHVERFARNWKQSALQESAVLE